MDRSTASFKDRLSETENARIQKATQDRDNQTQLDWDRLVELAQNPNGPVAAIARLRAPEATQRVSSSSTPTTATTSSFAGWFAQKV